MQTDLNGGSGLAVVAGDVLALRGTGLAAAETWALLCQAAQALQDLFLSNGGVVGGSRAGPVVTPHTLELTPRGRVLLQLAPPESARAYLPPEYRPGRVYSDTDSEKMWMYSLGRALLDTTPRVAALTGTVSVSPSSALQSVLAAMTEPDPRRRASLMNLLDVISEYCRTRLQSKPFTHIVMDMYREVVKSSQYTARKRMITYQHLNPPLRNQSDLSDQNRRQTSYPHHHHPQQPPQQPDSLQSIHNQANKNPHHNHHHHHHHHHHHLHHQDQQYRSMNHQYNHQSNQHRSPARYQPHQHIQQFQEASQQAETPKIHHYHHHHPAKGALFKLQSRNSHSHPNLTSLCGQQSQQNRRQEVEDRRTQFQSQMNVQASGRSVVGPVLQHQRRHHHSRTYSQPIYTRLQHTRSSGNLPSTIVGESNPGGNVYSDPIYALPVKPFLSSQDVRVNGLSVKTPVGHRNEDVYTTTAIARRPSIAGYSHPDIATSSSAERTREEIYGRSTAREKPALQRQHSNPQLPSRDQDDFERVPEQSVTTTDHRCPADRGKEEQQGVQQQNPVSSMRMRSVQGPPKPPRIITTLKKLPFSDVESNKSEPPAKPPRNLIKNGPRARRGKAVQRAPSRLYRTIGGPTRSFNKAQCVGPEFVVRANQPPKTLCVGQVKTGNSGRIVVIMLTGQRVEVTCDPQKVTAGDLFQAIMQAESLDENFTLGLAVLLAGDFAILPPDTKLNKVAPPGWLSSGKSKGLLGLPTSFMLYLRLRFFLPSLRGVRSWISKHLLYLQIRRCILEQQLVCPYAELINLTGLALQAEFGNYNVNEHGCGDYFLLEHYIPESLILSIDQHQSHVNNEGPEALRARLHQAHRDRRGLDSNKAEEMFITHAQTLPDYGSHYYIATVDSKELEKVMAQQKRRKAADCERLIDSGENIYDAARSQECQGLRGRVEISRLGSCENIPKLSCDERKPSGLAKSATTNDIYHKSKYRVDSCNNNNINNNVNNNSNHGGKSGKGGKKKTESNVWLAIHAQGLKLFERGGEPRERVELAQFQWKDIQTLSYSKSCLVVYSKVNGKRCKFKLRMDHRKSYFAFKLTSLHHQFFLRLRSELTSLQGLAKEFGVPMTVEAKCSPSKSKSYESKTKIAIANTVKNRAQSRPSYSMQLEEYQNKENENPQKDSAVIAAPKTKDVIREPGFYSSEEDALYAQVNVRLEPEGESRDTEDESERSLTSANEPLSLDGKGLKSEGKIYNCPRIELETETECGYSLPKIVSSDDVDQLEKPDNPEELYAAINKVGISRKNEFPVPDEVWDVSDVKKSLHKMKTSSLPNYGTSRQSGGYRTPSLPRRLGVKMGTRAIYSSLVQKDTALTDDMESLSLKSDTESSIQSLSARSAESPLPEAYVLNADIRTDDETFRVPEDESMSASLAARLEELSFAEERILQTIKLERGHGGSIGLQVTEGTDGGVYVQAVSVGGSADMAGNVNKGDRIVAINGQNLLHLRYEDALKMLQSSSDTIELVLSQPTSRKNATSSRQNHEQPAESNYLNDIRFDVSSEADTSSMTNKWLVQRTTDVASVQNTSSAYSSAASSAMGNHNANSLYMADLVDNGALKSASMLLSIEDFDVSRTSAESANSAPPIPPRRRKRKVRPPAIAKSLERTSPSSSARKKKTERKRLAPPPPPPRPLRRIESPKSKDRRRGIEEIDVEGALNSLSSVDTCETSQPSSIQFEEAESRISNVDVDLEARRQRSEEEEERNERRGATSLPQQQSPFMFEALSRKETNKYPPLLFTLHDFQNVMADTLQHVERDDGSKDSPKNSLDDRCRDSFHEFFEKSLDDEGSELSFRVTTTNLPFEKCLDRWAATLEDQIIENMDQSSFIFEDYMDRSNKVNIRRSSAPMCYTNEEEEEEPRKAVAAKLTKVRFVIESPNSSTPDHELDDAGLPSIDSLASGDADGWNRASSVQLTEITNDANWTDTSKVFEQGLQEDEFGDVPFSSVLRNSSEEWSLEDASNLGETIGCSADRFNSTEFDSKSRVFSWPEQKLEITEIGEEEGFGDGSLTGEKDGFNSAEFDSKSQAFSWPREKLEITEVDEEEEEKEEFGDESLKEEDSFNTTSRFDSKNQVCPWPREKLKITEVGEEGLDLECCSVLAENGGFASNNVEDNKEYLNERNSTNKNITGIISETAATGTEDNTDSKSVSIGNEINGNFVGKGWREVSEKEDSFAENKSTINKTKVLDQATNQVGNNVLKNNLLSNIRESETSGEASSIEEDTNVDGRVKIIEQSDKSTGEYKRKIFVNESLRNMMNNYCFTSNDLEEESEDSDDSNACETNENENCQKKAIDTDRKSQDNRNESLEKKSVPVDIRRNFFLENMLSEDTDESWTSCRIIAAHPKSPAKRVESGGGEERKVADRLNESIRMDFEIQKILQGSKKVDETGSPRPTARSTTRKVVETGKKNASDVKCDVLNELLSNFNSIRLKPVNAEKKKIHPRVERTNDDDEEGIASRNDPNDSNSPFRIAGRTNDENINSRSTAKQWRNAACLTTRKILNSWKCDNEAARKQSQDDVNFSEPSIKLDKTDSCSTKQHRACPTRRTILMNQVSQNDSSVETGVQGAIKLAENGKVSSDVGNEGSSERTNDEERTKNEKCKSELVRTREVEEKWTRKSDAVEGTSGGGGREHVQTCSEKTERLTELSAISGEQKKKKSAIARRNSRPHCNNNDNNRAVTTPVVLSDDQSRDVVTITPGRVRKFVKYYEIRHEVTTDRDSKTNDRVDREGMSGHRSVYSIRRGLEAKTDTKKKRRDEDSSTDEERSSADSRKKESRDDRGTMEKVGKRESSTIHDVVDLVEDDDSKRAETMRHVSSCTRAGKTKRKKSVKFQGGFTVIGAKSLEDNGPVGSPGDGQNAIERRKIPDRPRQRGAALVDKVDFQDGQPEELADADSRSLEDRDIAAAQIQAAAKCEECSGINRFVSKPETPRLVFYCTV